MKSTEEKEKEETKREKVRRKKRLELNPRRVCHTTVPHTYDAHPAQHKEVKTLCVLKKSFFTKIQTDIVQTPFV